ncbi:MAG: hypothetical protein ACLSAP_05000 [Oscillospiraceae bacterium]
MLEVVRAAGEQVGITYQNWQGTFSAIFMMAIQPAVFGENFYFLAPYIMLTALLGGIFFFCYAFFRKMFHASRAQFVTLSAVLCIICTQFLPSASQGFYWYNGAVFYTFFFGISLVLYALVIVYLLSGNRVWRAGYLIGISLCCIVIGGSNYVTSLVTVLLFGLLLVMLFIKRNPKWKALLIPFFLMAAAFIINAQCPAMRCAEHFSGHSRRYQSGLLCDSICGPFCAELVHIAFDLPADPPAASFVENRIGSVVFLPLSAFWFSSSRRGFTRRCSARRSMMNSVGGQTPHKHYLCVCNACCPESFLCDGLGSAKAERPYGAEWSRGVSAASLEERLPGRFHSIAVRNVPI